jgi:hypothetical protein
MVFVAKVSRLSVREPTAKQSVATATLLINPALKFPVAVITAKTGIQWTTGLPPARERRYLRVG